jgi:signal transduction histidine kinase
MDAALAPLLLQENARAHESYAAAKGADEAPWSPYVKLHFEIGAGQNAPAPLMRLGDAALQSLLQAAVPKDWISVLPGSPVPPPAPSVVAARDPIQVRNVQDSQLRGQLSQAPVIQLQQSRVAPVNPAPPPDPVRMGAMVPVWIEDDLFLARRVRVGSREVFQSSWIDWQKSRKELLASIEDLLPGSDLIPERGAFDPAEGRTLTSLPLRLVPGRVPGAEEDRSPILVSLKLAWAGIVVAILASGALLLGAISLSQRRAAFVSSVTHELRTPLTTFRMYTEMLVEGMAADPEKQSKYHQVLYRESDRLVHLVENVLSYARLERGRYGHREAIPVGDLIGRVSDRLAERARLGGMELVIAFDGDAAAKVVNVDASAIERILFNLVDNACKYAASATDKRIHIETRTDGRWAQILVRDHGPGIASSRKRGLFAAFQKTAKEAAKSAPGIGIGLHLSRRLASAAGGRLEVVDSDGGACLRLDLPLQV